jgi:hypothetical protein
MGIKSQTFFLVILITIISIGCKKSVSTSISQSKTIAYPNTLVGTWVLKSNKSIPLYKNNIDYTHFLSGNVGKDTTIVEQEYYFKQYFDSITFKRDSSFYGYFNTNGNQFAMSGQWSISDSVLTFDNIQIFSNSNNSVQVFPSNYWLFDEKEGKNLALATTALCLIKWESCEADISFERDEISYIRLR